MMRRPVRFLWLVCLMALAFGLCACQEENAPKAALDKETASAVVAKAAAGLQAPEAPAPAEEAARRVLLHIRWTLRTLTRFCTTFRLNVSLIRSAYPCRTLI